MPNVGLTIEIAPLQDGETFTPLLDSISKRLIDIVPLYDSLYAAFRKIEQRRFDKEGPGWAPLADSTVAGREALGIGGEHPILNRTGELRKSLTTKGAKGAVVEPMVDGLFMGTDLAIARYHQDGTHGAGRDHNVSMPARPVVDMTEADADVFASIVSEWVYDPFSASVGVESTSFTAYSNAI